MNHGLKIHLARHLPLPLPFSPCIFSFPGPANNCDAACGGWAGLRWRLEILNLDMNIFGKLLQLSFRGHQQYSDEASMTGFVFFFVESQKFIFLQEFLIQSKIFGGVKALVVSRITLRVRLQNWSSLTTVLYSKVIAVQFSSESI